MPFFSKLFSGFRIHKIFKPQQLIIKMLYGFLQRSAVLTSICKCPCDPYSAHGVQTIGVLYNFSLRCQGGMGLVLAE